MVAWNKVGSVRVVERRWTLGSILKGELKAFANGWDVGCERKTIQG